MKRTREGQTITHPIAGTIFREKSVEDFVLESGSVESQRITIANKEPFVSTDDPLDKALSHIQQAQQNLRTKGLVELVHLLDTLPFIEIYQKIKTIELILRRQIKVEEEVQLKLLMQNVLVKICHFVSVDSNVIIEELISHIGLPKKLTIHTIQSMQHISPHIQGVDRIIQICLQYLKHSNVELRMNCIKTISTIYHPDTCKNSLEGIVKTVKANINDIDGRVRQASLRCLLKLHSRGIGFGDRHIALYRKVCSVLEDEYDEVRYEALKLIWVLSLLTPEDVLPGSHGNTRRLRMVDDGFSKLCAAVTDSSVQIRSLACSLLGSFQNVTLNFILQTLGKEVLSGQHKGKLSLTRGKVTDTSELPEDDYLLETGAVGAFITGLEDEFLEVRNATVDSMCELSVQSITFAQRAVDFLVDMFNDEIDSVRINAINSLTKIGDRIQLKEDQLHIVLSGLEDSLAPVRMAIHNLLKVSPLSNITCLHATVQALLTSMISKYPSDQISTFLCLKEIGLHHGRFMEFLIEDLFHIDSRFMSSEPHLDDLNYIGVTIVVCNAAVDNPNIIPLLPRYVFKHYHYLREKYPQLYPVSLPVMSLGRNSSASSLLANEDQLSTTEYGVEHFFSKAQQIIHKQIRDLLVNQQHAEVMETIKMTAKDLKRASSLDKTMSPNAEFYLLYLKFLQLFVKVSKDNRYQGTAKLKEIARKMFALAYQMENLFVGLDFAARLQIMEFRIAAHMLLSLEEIDTKLQMRCDLHKKYSLSNGVELQQLAQELTAETLIPSKVFQLFKNYVPIPPVVPSLLKSTSVAIHSPRPNSERPAEYIGSGPISLTMDATLNYLPNSANIMIQAILPEGEPLYFPIPGSCIVPVSHYEYSMQTDIRIAPPTNIGQDPYPIQLCVVQLCGLDIPQDSQFIRSYQCNSSSYGVLPLCKSIQYHVKVTRGRRSVSKLE